MSFPIQIVIPTSTNYLAGSYLRNPEFIFCNEEEVVPDAICPGNANAKRNYGAKQGKEPYILFCDDDILWKPGALFDLYEALLNSKAGYSYCNFICFNHPCPPYNFIHKAGAFDRDRLRTGNYISTMSLVRREAFEAVGGFDESIERLMDWDLWLSMLKQGIEGIWVDKILFLADYTNSRITKATGYKEAEAIIRKKHGL